MRKKIVIGLTVLFGTFLLLGFGFGGAVGYFQPQDGGTALVITSDSQGVEYETVLRPVEDESGQIWLLSGQWFRG